MKNIVLLVSSLTVGGRERIAVNTYKCLKDNYNLFFVVFNRVGSEYEFPYDIHSLDVPATNNKIKKFFNLFLRGRRLLSFCKKNKIDCIYSFGEAANLAGAFVKRFLNIKLICAIHGFREVYKGSVPSYFVGVADKIICISQDMEREFLGLYPQAPTCIVENGYEIKSVENHAQFDPMAPRLAAMGRMVPVKAFHRLILAFKGIKEVFPQATLTIIGEGPLRENLSNLAEENHVFVNFVGYKEDPTEELIKHNIFVLSSKNEGFPNSLIEALSCGLCVVSVDCKSGPREILSEKYTPERVKNVVFEKYGVLVEESERVPLLLKEAVCDLVKDKEKRDYYRAVGPHRAKDFSLEVYKEKIKKLL